MKLHLGCGNVHLPGYLNIDIKDGPAVDEVGDIADLQIPDGAASVIYAASVLEHFGRAEWLDVLRHWHAKLSDGGVLRLSVPDFDAVFTQYMEHGDLPELLGLLIGGQKDEYDWHGMIFNCRILVNGLEAAGFSGVRRWDWREAGASALGIDDLSQAFLPHMDKENGRLMMLNLEGVK